MATIEQVQRGMVRFIDAEVIPRLSAMETLVVGSGGILFAAKLPTVVKTLSENKLVSALELYDEEKNEIDIDALYNAMKPYITPDAIPVKIPFTGVTLKFTQQEFDMLYRYIKEV